MTQISMSGAAVEFGATTLFHDVTFTVGAGERWGIIGRNGTGKTTLFKILTSEMEPTRGAVARQPGLTLSLLEQHRDFGGATTVWEAAAGQFAELLALEQSLQDQAAALSESSDEEALHRYGHDLERFGREGGYEIASNVDSILHGLGFDPAAARTIPVDQLSGGERGRLGLARQLASPADVLLLDEPTNHLDLETTAWLERYLAGSSKTVLLVSHDRAFLAAVVDHVLHFEAGTATPYAGGYESFVRQRAERYLTAQRNFQKQQRVIAQEEDYIARNIAGQNSKQAKGRRKRLARLPRLSSAPGAEDTMAVRFEVSERGGERVAIADHATVSVEDRVLVENFSATLMRGDVLGFIGPNGAGKSTLVRTLLGERATTEGELKIGASIRPAYYRQDMAQVALDSTLYDIIAELRPRWERRQVQGHLGRFGFSGDEVFRRAATLSGGERARVALAMLMLSGANLLVLDEPTNHLDVESIEALEDALDQYDGTVILVSHDRALLRALTTRMWVLHDCHVADFSGGFEEWETVASEREHAASVRAAEEQSLRKVRERQKTSRRVDAPGSSAKSQRSARDLRSSLEKVEVRISALELRVQQLTAALEAPELYTRGDGVSEARRMGAELEEVRGELDGAMEEWTRISEELDQNSPMKPISGSR